MSTLLKKDLLCSFNSIFRFQMSLTISLEGTCYNLFGLIALPAVRGLLNSKSLWGSIHPPYFIQGFLH